MKDYTFYCIDTQGVENISRQLVNLSNAFGMPELALWDCHAIASDIELDKDFHECMNNEGHVRHEMRERDPRGYPITLTVSLGDCVVEQREDCAFNEPRGGAS